MEPWLSLTAKMGVEAQTETVWRQANKYQIPRLCFINKINQTGGDFHKSLASIHQRLSKKAYIIHLPIGFEQGVRGLVDVVEQKAYVYKDYTDKELVETEIPAEMVDEVQAARADLVENAVVEDEDILTKYLEVGLEGLSLADIKRALRAATLTGEFYLVSGGRWSRRHC